MKKLIVLLLIICFTAGAADATIRKGPYLIYPGTNTEMMVLWQLTGTLTCTLEWGEDTSYSTGSVQTTEYGSDHQHEHIITNLTPGTKYYYQVIEDVNHTGTFYAAPSTTATSTKFLAFGDCRTNTDIFDSVAAGMINTYEADSAYQTFTMLTGDWVESGKTDSHWQDQFFNRSYSNILDMQANLPINGCIGNHETLLDAGDDGNMFLKYWPYPYVNSGWDSYWTPGTHFWSFDYGPMHITCIDQYDYSYGSISDAQLDWIENDLWSTDRDWRFIQLHEPGYSADGQGGHVDNTQVQEEIQPLCEMYGVKIVFGGHNHYYARCEKDGITHFTLGGAGASLDTPDPEYSPYVVSTAKKNNFAKFAISGNSIDVVVYEPNGAQIESFNLSNVWSGEVPWSDGFESGDLETGGWYISDSRYVSVQSTEVYEGTYAAEIERANYLWNPVSTVGSSNIHVKYARKTASLEGSDALKVEWSVNGSDWYLLESTQDASWAFVDKTCGTGANDSRSFRVRFRLEGGSKDYAYVDSVQVVTGGPPPPVISGLVRESDLTPIDGVSVDANNSGGSDTTDQTGYYEVTVPDGWSGTVTPTKGGWTFEPTYRSYSNVTSDQTDQNYTGTYAGAPEIYVYDIGMAGYEPKEGRYAAKATIWITDTELTDIADATVTGDWTGATQETGVQGVTLGDGKVTIESAAVKGGGDYTFTVTDVSATGYTYDSTLNNETSDSITLPEPGPELDMYVYDITMAGYEGKKTNYYYATATVWIKDVCDIDVNSATITGDWTGAAPESGVQEVTEDGKATFTSGDAKGGGVFTFTVTDVTATGYTYNSTLNNETSDSVTMP